MDYAVATIKPWNIRAFRHRVHTLPGRWHLFDDKDTLTADAVAAIAPRYLFFPHWSWLVPPSILDLTECVLFHATDVPFGRGGSPVQNLIVRGYRTTVLSALRMVPDLDAGPVYLKRPLDLSGSARDIYERMAALAFEMIAEIVADEPEPVAQSGPVVVFKRRQPAESVLPPIGTLDDLYDHIRMLDADTYPRAFLNYGDLRLEFSDAERTGDGLAARVRFCSRSSGNG